MSKVALITGGVSGIGLAVASMLAAKGWKTILLDLNAQNGETAVASVPSSTFIQCDVSNYDAFAAAFDRAFKLHGRFDLVFANAGIIEREYFYREHPADGPPPLPNMAIIDVDLNSVIYTAWLAQHYFKQNPHSDGGNLILTSSCCGLYSTGAMPRYAAAKHGVIGFMRSISQAMYAVDKVRVNAICPGSVQTGIFTKEEKDALKFAKWTPMSTIVSAVEMLMDEKPAPGQSTPYNGKAVDLSMENHYFHDQAAYDDDVVKNVGLVDGTQLDRAKLCQ